MVLLNRFWGQIQEAKKSKIPKARLFLSNLWNQGSLNLPLRNWSINLSRDLGHDLTCGYLLLFFTYTIFRLTKRSNMSKVSLWVPSLVVSDLSLIARLEILKFQSKTNDTKRFSYFIWKIMSNLKPFSIYY